MRTIGLLGGMSWESTVLYYQEINRLVAGRLGGLHSADVLLHSFDFQAIADLMHDGDWDGLARHVSGSARRLERAGAECLLICTNTVHHVAPAVADAVDVPLLHIADAAGEAARAGGFTRVGLMGTRFTMELDFYAARLDEGFGIETIVPDAEDRTLLDRVIFGELVKGRFEDASRSAFNAVIGDLAQRGAQAVVLGCTEIPLLVRQEDCPVPLIDTARLHAAAAVNFALGAA